MQWLRAGSVAVALCLSLATVAAPDTSFPSGEPLAEALARLERLGLKIVFTSEVVTPAMHVAAEPSATEPRAILDELLAPHGLEARAGPRGTLVIVRRPDAAPRGVLSGRIVFGVHDDPVAGAAVRILESGARAVSGPDGRFRVPDLAQGRYTVEIGRAGFAVERRAVEISAGETVDLAVRLASTQVEEAIVVTPSRVSLLRDDPVSTVGLSGEEIQALPHLGDDFFRAVPVLPGITANDVSAQFNVRGGRTDEVQILLDGQELFEAYHLKDFDSALSFVPSSKLKSADLTTGGFPAEYGDRMSGVLSMTTDTPSGDAHGELVGSLLYLSAGGSGGFRGDRGSWLVDARRGTADLIGDLIGETSPEYADAYAKVGYQLDPRNSLELNVLYSTDDFELQETDGPDFKRTDTAYRSSYAWLTHRASIGKGTLVETAVSVTGIRQDRRGTELEEDVDFDVRDRRDTDVLGVRQGWTAAAGARNLLKWGWELRSFDTAYDYLGAFTFDNPLAEIRDDPGPGMTVFDGEVEARHQMAYLTDRITIGEPARLELGARYDRTTWTNESYLSPRANLAVNLGARTVLRASWGRYLQSQRPYELQVQDGEAAFQPTERSDHRILGIETSFPHALDGIMLRAEFYRRRVNDPRPRYENLWEKLSTFPEMEPDRVRIAPIHSTAEGIELVLQGRVGSRLGFGLNYAWASTEDDLESGTAPRGIDQTHAVNLGLDARLGRAWRLYLAWRYHTGWPTTPLSLAPDVDDAGDPVFVPVLGPLNSERVAAYHRLDLRASRSFALRHGGLELFIDVQNVYDRQNVAGFDYQIDEVAGTIDAEVEYWIGFLPSAGVIWSF